MNEQSRELAIRPARKLVAGVLTFVFLAVLLLALAEGAMRVRAWIKYGSAEPFESMYHFDTKLGIKYPIPGYSTRTIQVNSQGFRGDEITSPKAPDTTRIAFLGGSTTYSAEVSSNAAVWPHLVWDGLRKEYPERKFDYVNGGVPGYTLSSSLTNLEHRIAPLEPDIIVIYHASNDMTGELRDVARSQGVYKEAHTGGSWLDQNSLLWHLASMNLTILRMKGEASNEVARLKSLPENFGEDFQTNLEGLVRQAQQHAKFVAVVTWAQQARATQPAEQKLKATESALYYMPFITPDILLNAYGLYNKAIRQAAENTGALLVTEEDSIPGDATHFNDAVHFKDAGSQLMADRVVRGLLASQAFTDGIAN